VEVVGDPYDAYAPGSVKHPLRPALRWGVPWILRQQCSGACAVSYVTEHALQLRYPPAEGAFSTFYSSVELPDNVLVSAPRAANASLEQFTLISVGTLAQLYKAPDVLIRAIARCVEGGLDLTLIWIGDGKHRAELEVLAERLGLTRRVRFLGQLPAGEAIRSHLDKADIFVLPSYQEGVPRAMIEAMARGLPCIGSSVGGIPELLPSQDMVPAGDIEALTEKIAEVVSGPQRLARMSSRNLARASDYRETVLSRRRKEFYDYVERCTRMWSRSRAA
jgi:glycosyltransferase involved in cell wall biosynthesis